MSRLAHVVATRVGLGTALAAMLAAGASPPPALAGDGTAAAAASDDTVLVARVASGPRTDDAARVLAWAQETAALGRARRDTRLGGDLLGAAAGALSSRGLSPDLAISLWREASAAYPRRCPRATEAWLEVARVEHDRGRPAEALAALDEFEREAGAPPPVDEPSADALDRRRLASLLEGYEDDLRCAVDRDLGRFDEACARDEARARALEGADPERAGVRWEAAGRAAWRAGDVARATADVERGLAIARDDASVVERTIWLLHARRGWLDDAGDFRGRPDAWDDGRALDDALATLRSLEGRRGAWRRAVRLATYASLSGHERDALDLFDVAFRDPEFADAARLDEVDRAPLVVAARAAWKLGEAALAGAYLDAAEAFAGGPIAATADLRALLDEALRPERAVVAPAPPPARTPDAAEAPSTRGAASPSSPVDRAAPTLETAGSPEGGTDAAPPTAIGEGAAIGGGAALFVVAAVLATRARSRRGAARRGADPG